MGFLDPAFPTNYNLRMCFVKQSLALAAGLLLALPATAGDLSLVMVERAGCAWCARWNAEIAPIWPKTDEGRAAPLRRVDLNAPAPEDLTLNGRVVFTPTFILTDDGQEVARLEGYPGEDFFWPLISDMITQVKSAPTLQEAPK